jgi:carbonic anhydrase/acetyltransferase-like protein (isoleucine patch superfamily)
MKYELTTEKNEAGLYRIKALRDIPRHGVRAGDLGGFVASEHNLSQEGDAWIGENAKVYGEAKVCGKAAVSDYAVVYGDAKVYNNAKVCGNAEVHGNAQVFNDAVVYGNADVYGNAEVNGDAEVGGKAEVYGPARVLGKARVNSPRDFLCIGPIGSRDDYTTFFRVEDGMRVVACGYFQGTLDDFKARVEMNHKDNSQYLAEYRAAIAFFEAVAEAREKPLKD